MGLNHPFDILIRLFIRTVQLQTYIDLLDLRPITCSILGIWNDPQLVEKYTLRAIHPFIDYPKRNPFTLSKWI